MKTVRIGDVAEQVRGVTFSKADAVATPREGYLPVLTASNIQEGQLVTTDLTFVPSHMVRDKQHVRVNDVVVCTSSGSLSVVGKAARSRGEFAGGFGAFLKVLRPGPGVDPGYFAHFFQTPEYRRRVSSLAAGANINNLKNEHLDEFALPFLPLAEQRRITAILDHADALRTTRLQVLTHLDALTQSIFHDMFGRTAQFDSARMKDLIKWKSGKFLPAKEQHGGAHPVYGGNGVNGWHDQYMYEEPRLVVGRVGAYCGAVHITRPQAWVTDNALIATVLRDDLTLGYLLPALTLANLNQYAGVSGQPSISAGKIGDVRLPVPAVGLQREFAGGVQQIDSQRAAVQRANTAADALFASLQSRAFRGEL